MWPRLRLDVRAADVARGVLALGARDAAEHARVLERAFCPEGDGLACLSVRSAFDLFFAAAGLARGSEVLVSAITIPDMARVVELHGLVAVPLDLDPDTLLPRPETLSAAITPRTRACVVAHLFGCRSDVGELARLAHEHGILFAEDAAQAFDGTAWRGSDVSDLVLFSFGTIKTATAFGGATARVRDPKLRERMRALRDAQPRQTRRHHARRLAKGAFLAALSRRAPFTLLARAARALGVDFESFLHGATRGFAGEELAPAIRRRPSAPLLALLARRLRGQGCAHRVARRRDFAEALLQSMPLDLRVGARAEVRTHWVVPLRTPRPDELVSDLRAAGFDATRRSSLVALEPPPGRAAPNYARGLLAELVFVPAYPAIGSRGLARLGGVLRATLQPASADPASIEKRRSGGRRSMSAPAANPRASRRVDRSSPREP